MIHLVDNNTGRHLQDTNTGRAMRDLLSAEDTYLAAISFDNFNGGNVVENTVQDAVVNESTNAVTLSAFNLAITSPANLKYLTGPITYTSSDPAVATVDASGQVTPKAPGNVSILVNCPGLNNRRFDLTIVQNLGQNAVEFLDFVAGSLGNHLVNQIQLLQNGPNATPPEPALSTLTSLPPDRATYPNIFMFNADGTRNANVWTGTLDTSCIPRGSPGCLITPDAIAYAAHVGNPVGIPLTFVGMDGSVHTVTVTATASVTPPGGDGDIQICKLSAALPSSVKPVALLPGNYASYLPQPQYRYPVLFTNQDNTLLLGDVVNFTATVNSLTEVSVVQPLDSNRKPWFYSNRGLDSGRPVFMVINGNLVMVTLWHLLGNYGPNYMEHMGADDSGTNDINAALTAVGSAYAMTAANLSAFPTY